MLYLSGGRASGPASRVSALLKNLPMSLSVFDGSRGARRRRFETETDGKAVFAMALYEHVFLVRQDVSAAQVETLSDQFKTIITDGGGKVGKAEYWGLKSLTFRIRKNRKAHYSLMNIDAPHAAVAEMERQMRLNEDVIRYLTLNVDEHEDEPSAMMRSRGGRDRDDRRPGRDDRPRRDSESTRRGSESKSAASSGNGSDKSGEKSE